MEKKINLEEVLRDSLKDYGENGFYGLRTITTKQKELILLAIKEACRQTLELAAENARCDAPYGVDVSHMISKQSILDTINQIEL